MISDIIETKAQLTPSPTNKGGRKTGIKTGYRPKYIFDYKQNSSDFITKHIGQIDFNKELIFPSETEIVNVWFLKYQNISDFIKKRKIMVNSRG